MMLSRTAFLLITAVLAGTLVEPRPHQDELDDLREEPTEKVSLGQLGSSPDWEGTMQFCAKRVNIDSSTQEGRWIDSGSTRIDQTFKIDGDKHVTSIKVPAGTGFAVTGPDSASGQECIGFVQYKELVVESTDEKYNGKGFYNGDAVLYVCLQTGEECTEDNGFYFDWCGAPWCGCEFKSATANTKFKEPLAEGSPHWGAYKVSGTGTAHVPVAYTDDTNGAPADDTDGAENAWDLVSWSPNADMGEACPNGCFRYFNDPKTAIGACVFKAGEGSLLEQTDLAHSEAASTSSSVAALEAEVARQVAAIAATHKEIEDLKRQMRA